MLDSLTAQAREAAATTGSGRPSEAVHADRNGTSSAAPEAADAPVPAPGSASGNRRRRILLTLLLLVAGGAATGAWYRFGSGSFARLWLGKPDDGRLLVLEGNIDVRQVNLAFKVEGRIETLAVDEGDRVEAGKVLATLDARYFEDDLRLARAQRDNQKAVLERLEHGSRPEEISEARAALAECQAVLENARRALERRASLVEKGTVTREEYDNARAAHAEARARQQTAEEALRLAEIGPRREDIDAARAGLRAQEASVSQAERRLADSRLIAPVAGIILTRAREVGAIVQPGETVFTLTLTSPVWVRTYVSETELGRVVPGMEAEVITDGNPRRIFRGHVGFISPTAEFTPKTVETRELRTRLVYRLRVVVQDPRGDLRQGMPVTVRLPLAGGAGTP